LFTVEILLEAGRRKHQESIEIYGTNLQNMTLIDGEDIELQQ
jgi:hypothetical protein